MRDLPLTSSAGAGHTLRGKYRVYGEGSVRHNRNPCGHGLNLDRHPLITRTDYDSIWHYAKVEIADWWAGVQMGRLARSGVFERLRAEGTTKSRVADLPSDRLNRLMLRLFGPPYPRLPSVEAALQPEDSIYDRRED